MPPLSAPEAPKTETPETQGALPTDNYITGGINEAEAFANNPANATQLPSRTAPSATIQGTADVLETGVTTMAETPSRVGRAAASSKLGSKIKNASHIKKALLIGGPVLAAVAAVAAIMFFLMLFKNIHIEHLFMDYQFAKFNRTFNRAMVKAVHEAAADGKTANVPATDDPMKQLDGVGAEEMNKLKTDPEALSEEVARAEELMITDVGPNSPGSAVGTELGFEDRGLPTEDPAKPPAEAKSDAAKNIDTEVEGKGNDFKAPESISKIVDGAKEDAAAGKTMDDVKANALKNVEGSFKGFFGDAAAGLFIATFACIAQDIYETSSKAFAKYKASSLARVATSLGKRADCQKVGECSLSVIAATSDAYGNGLTNSAGYQRASHKPVTAAGTDNDLDPDMSLAPTGTDNQLLAAAKRIASSSFAGASCSVILDPKFQVGAMVTLIGGQVAVLLSGLADFGLSDAILITAKVTARAGVSAVATFLATKVGKALVLKAVLHYAGLIFHGPVSPTARGNMTDAGFKVLAASTFTKVGAYGLSAAENQQQSAAAYRDQINSARQQGLAYQLLSPENPYSVAGLAIDNIPTTIGGAASQFSTALATCFNPAKFFTSLARIGFSSPAYAAVTVESKTYGIPDVGISDSIIDKWTVKQNTDWVNTNIIAIPDIKAKYDKCFDTAVSDRWTSHDLDYCDDATNETYQRYIKFKLDQAVAHSIVYLNNTQTDDGSNNISPDANPDTTTASCGTAQQCAQKLLQDTHVTYDDQFSPKRPIRTDVVDTANNTPIISCTPHVELNAIMLDVLLKVSQKYDIKLSTLVTGHSCSSARIAHGSGRAFDVDMINGKATFSDLTTTVEFVKYIATLLPNRAGIGQSQCQGINTINFPATIVPRIDTCNHIHIDMGDTAP